MKHLLKKYRVILWGAWYGSNNVGDQALLLSITDIIGGAFEDVEFTVITANPRNLIVYVGRDSSQHIIPLHSRQQFPEVIKAFFSADLFIFGGGVPFYDDTLHSMAIVFLVTLSRIFKVPCILWSVSSLQIRFRFTELILRYVLSSASIVTCRDMHTYQLFKKCGKAESQIQIAADSAFTLRSNNGENAGNILKRAGWHSGLGRPLIALTPRTLRGMDGESHTHYTPKKAFEYQKEIGVFAGVLDWLWENGYQPIFVPMNTAIPDNDLDAARQVMMKAKFGKNALTIDEPIFPRDSANVYRYCQAALVARVHGAVTAFLGRCPVIMYAFDLKHRGIMEQMGLTDYIFNPEQNDQDDAIRLISQAIDLRIALKEEMELKQKGLLEQARVPLEAIISLRKPK